MFVLLLEKGTGRSLYVLPETVRGVLPHEEEGSCYLQRLVGEAESTHMVQGSPDAIMERLGLSWGHKAKAPPIVINTALDGEAP